MTEDRAPRTAIDLTPHADGLVAYARDILRTAKAGSNDPDEARRLAHDAAVALKILAEYNLSE